MKISHFFVQTNACDFAISVTLNKKNILKTLWPLFMDEIQLPQGYRTTTRRNFTFYHLVLRNSWYFFSVEKTHLIDLRRMKDWDDLGTTGGRPPVFNCWSLQGSEQHHSSVEKEAQAISKVFSHWKHFFRKIFHTYNRSLLGSICVWLQIFK